MKVFMNPKKVEKKNSKVFEVNNIEIVGSYFVKSNYVLKLYSHNRITRTGHLPLASLEPKNTELPRFTPRWDQNDKIVNVDIYNVNDDIIKKFKNGENGC